MPHTLEKPTDFRDLQQVYSYLYRMSEELEGALNNLTAGDIKDLETRVSTAVSAATAGAASAGHLATQAANLRALIIDTADTIESSMDAITTELHGEYVARGQFGEVSEDYFRSIAEDALATENIYQYMSRIQTGNDARLGAAETFETSVRGSIRIGMLYIDDQGLPVYGVAVGREVQDKEYTYTDPETHETVTVNGVDTAKTLSMFTDNKLEFWIENNKVAYVSNQQLYITRGYFTREIRIGDIAGVIDGTDAGIVRWYVKDN